MGVIPLIALFSVKHLLGDKFFQSPLLSSNKRRSGWPGIRSLFLHSFLHGLWTGYLLGWYFFAGFNEVGRWRPALIFGLLDLSSHFTIDYFKVKIEKYLGKVKTRVQRPTVFESLALGLDGRKLVIADQLFHAGCYLLMIYAILRIH